jgi:hypothetical protein
MVAVTEELQDSAFRTNLRKVVPDFFLKEREIFSPSGTGGTNLTLSCACWTQWESARPTVPPPRPVLARFCLFVMGTSCAAPWRNSCSGTRFRSLIRKE